MVSALKLPVPPTQPAAAPIDSPPPGLIRTQTYVPSWGREDGAEVDCVHWDTDVLAAARDDGSEVDCVHWAWL